MKQKSSTEEILSAFVRLSQAEQKGTAEAAKELNKILEASKEIKPTNIAVPKIKL